VPCSIKANTKLLKPVQGLRKYYHQGLQENSAQKSGRHPDGHTMGTVLKSEVGSHHQNFFIKQSGC
jgi:hypothetical protein